MADDDYAEAAERIIAALFEVHPRPDYRAPMPVLQTACRRCREDAAACATIGEFVRLVGRLLHVVGDPHVTFRVPGRRRKTAPVWLTLVDGLPVVGDVVMPDLPLGRGDAILRVGGRDAPALMYERLERTAYVQAGSGLRGAVDQLLTFDEDECPGDEVDLLVAGDAGRVRRVALPLLPPDAAPFVAFERQYRAGLLRRLIRTDWRDEHRSAVLGYLSCQDRDTPGLVAWAAEVGVAAAEIPTMAETCAALFPEMRRRGTRHLVLDLRSNGGGSDGVTAPLWPYLFDGDVWVEGVQWRVSPTAQALRDDLSRWPLGERRVEPRAWRCGGAVDRFEGQVTVLIDGGTYSSGETVAQVLRDNRRARFVGEATGCGRSAGNVLSIPIPEVGGTLRCGCSLFIRPAQEQGAVYPDVLVRPTLADFRAGRDTVLEAGLAMGGGA